ncbi:MAG: ABC transporter ATP-binding protein [Ruminococcaceae bacterium]|nr:ABC transporter ATP-binding protein [Oscillospiraceae bacterium]
MLELKNLTHCYGEKTVIEGLSHCFPSSGTLLFSGPSGAGKTTLLRLIAGLEKPTAGEITSDHRRVAMCFQEPRLLPWLTCLDNIKLVLAGRSDADTLARLWLSRMELEEVENALPTTLSGGMQQRIALARALAFGGDLLLLDEPFSGLDEALKHRIAPFLREANPTGLTVAVTHQKEDAALLDATVLTLSGSPVTALV